ncbi:glycosyltransferase family 4 protein [Endozoicomonas sp. SESOKO1]|uniref:glycosyltransferase family 4 protein n=1 Tax=Endozoicomonas sp. SESOKO1 TaxID=2828742 RepID=UPI002147E79C|nr:glycosyltransferase family 4 protein [Endozoicomonas sp. SESOKO1]
MKIAFICNEYPPEKCGGIGIFTRELANALVENGNQVTIIGVYPNIQDDIFEELNGVNVFRLATTKGRFGYYGGRLKLFKKVKQLIKRNQIDIIEVPDFEGNCAFWPKLPIPVIVRLHGNLTYFADEMNQPVSKNTRRLEAAALKRADAIASVSQYTAERTKQLFNLNKDIKVIYNSVSLPTLERTKHSYKSTGMVAYSGSLVEKKGVFSLAKAWPKVCDQCPGAKLIMIGKDVLTGGQSSQEKIRVLAGKHSSSIHFTGHVSKREMEDILVKADLAIYPSYSEAFALAPMEAMALKIPVIYSSRSSGPELIKDGEHGLLCDPDNIDNIAVTILGLLKNEETRCEMAESGFRRVSEDFNPSVAIEKNLQFYRSLIH